MNVSLNSRPDLMAVLEDQGYRTTAPRRAIIDLLERKEEGFSAEEISEELPTVGRATVYRTIKLLLKAGVICKLAMMDGAPKYSLSRNEHHHHTVCVKCGEVGEFRAATVERLLRAIGGDIQGQVVGHRMEFYINCYQCIAADKSS
jgi:Fe2+ or Zn2+ uptake regulation protein